MSVLSQLDHQEIWKNFEALNAIPRASKKEEKVIAFMADFGKKLGLDTIIDAAGNVIIKKPASKGREAAPVVILQSHLDMVHQKNNETDFDFDTEGIQMYIDGDWVKAKGTTLGADNGLGVAAIMAVLESSSISHPAVEALFTIDEETGMTGAKGLGEGRLSGEILLNLDTEEDDQLGIGCAGGIDVTAHMSYETSLPPDSARVYTIEIKGLKGGHSGMDIHKGHANANKIMNRILYSLDEEHEISIARIDGGGLRNAIPRESTALIVSGDDIRPAFDKAVKEIIEESKTVETDMSVTLTESGERAAVMPRELQKKLLKSVYAAHNGVYRMSADFEDLVETSNNIARILVNNGHIEILCLTRSSVESSKQDLVRQLSAAFSLMGAEVETDGDYPGWTPDPHSQILKTMKKNYEQLFGDSPEVAACHAGLECGIIAGHYPHLDMISFGPTIRGAHSPDERLSIPSVGKFWNLLVNTLEAL